MTSDPPSFDTRTFEDIVSQIEELARSYLKNRGVYATSINAIRNSKPTKNSIVSTITTNESHFTRNTEYLRSDIGIALSKIFASFYMNILSRLNKLPRRNLIEFLNIMGFNLSSPIASRVPVSFKLADGAKEDVFIPSGTIVASDATDNHEELKFETEENMIAIRANLSQLYTVNRKIDAIYSHTKNLEEEKKDFKLFPDYIWSIQQHILYLGHEDLFNLKGNPARIFLTMEAVDKNSLNLLADDKNVVWEYVWKYDDKSKEISVGKLFLVPPPQTDENESVSNEEGDGITIALSYKANQEKKIEKTKINEIENHWIRCRFQPYNDKWNFTDIDKDRIPAITKVTAKVEMDAENPQLPDEEKSSRPPSSLKTPSEKTKDNKDTPATNGGFIKPDLLFYKDAPIIQVPFKDKDKLGNNKEKSTEVEEKKDAHNTSRAPDSTTSDDGEKTESDEFIYPFGKQPFTFDIFYIASNDCLSKKNTVITLKFFRINPDFKGKESKASSESRTDNSTKALSSKGTEGENGDNNQPPTSAEVKKSVEPTISWEYWNGKGWNGLSVFNLKLDEENEELEFLCPSDIVNFSVNGNDNYWIRARLVSGDYGKGRLVQTTVSTLTTRETRKIHNAEDGTTEDTTEKTTEWNAGTFEWDYGEIKAPKFKEVKVKSTDPKTYKIKKKDQEEGLTQLIDAQTIETLERASRPICMTYNNLEYMEIPNSDIKNHAPNKPISVFQQLIDYDKSNMQNYESDFPQSQILSHYVYLGFDKKIEGGPILIYVSILEERNYDDVGQQLNFYYFSSTGWKKLYVEDGTNYFTKRGYIKLFFPSDFQTHSLFGNSIYWIRIEDSANFYELEPFRIPTVQNFILNTVSCINAHDIEDELLAKDEKTLSDYKFVFSNKPLTLIESKREQIWVKEKISPSDIEWSTLSEVNRIKTVNDALGNLIETWVLWKEFGYQSLTTDVLSQFSSLSQYDARTYTIDRTEGKLSLGSIFENSFGGFEASIPTRSIPSMKQIGVDTLVKANYTAGGGSQGNVNVEEIKTLKSLIPFIDSVTNYDEGRGGSDIQSIQEAVETAPTLIKNRGQAVTVEDFERLIKSNFSSISRVKCFPTTDNHGIFHPGHVLLVVIPKMDSKANSKGKDGKVNQTDHTGHSLQAEMPYPSVALLKGIEQFLIEKASGTIISLGKLHVTGPSYFRIFISANLYVTRIDDLPVAQKKALDLIKKFLDPIKGGKDGMGWEFQKILRISDIHSLFSDIPEVEYVDSVFVRIEIDKSNLMSVHRSDIDKPMDEHILSETNSDSDTDAITSKLLPHSLLYDGKAHNLTMKISSQK